MKTTAEKIAVMQAYESGKEIEYKPRNGNAWMALAVAPSWDWISNDYRSADPKPDSIDWSQVPDAYRFMARNENGTATLFKSKPDLYPFGWSVMVEGETEFEKYTFAVSAQAHTSYKNNGIGWWDSLVERPRADVAQPKADRVIWRLIPEKYRYVARDKNGSVFLYENKPSITPSEWFCTRQSHVNINHFYDAFTKGSIPWNESLIERPATQESK